MTIRLNKEKILNTRSVFKKDLLELVKRSIPVKKDGNFFILKKSYKGIARIKKDFAFISS